MRQPFRALRSLKLAIALLAYFAVTGIAASFIPQDRETDYYRTAFPGIAAELALKTGFTRFYSSLLFLAPAFLFVANLSSCAAFRLSRELRKDRKKRKHGPDILHFGLVLLAASIVIAQVAKQGSAEARGFVRLGVGEAVQLSGGKILLLKSLREERYNDGRPKDWVSVVELWKDGALLLPEREIRVNRPLRLGGLSIRQSTFGSERALRLRAASGVTRSLAGGESLELESSWIRLMSVDLDAKTALALEEPKPAGGAPAEARTIGLGIGSKLGDFTVAGTEKLSLSGLMASYDPFFPAIVASLVIAVLGICLTLAQKLAGGPLE